MNESHGSAIIELAAMHYTLYTKVTYLIFIQCLHVYDRSSNKSYVVQYLSYIFNMGLDTEFRIKSPTLSFLFLIGKSLLQIFTDIKIYKFVFKGARSSYVKALSIAIKISPIL